MVMSGFSQLELEKRLTQLKDTAESVQSLSAWCIKYKHQHRRIVNSWLKVIKRAKVQQRLPLFYLANDVIQCSRRKNLEFVGSFQTVLEGAMPLVRDEKLRPAITRILKIWEDRGIYDSAYIATLTNFVSNAGKADTKENAQILSDFRTSDLIQRLREMEDTEKETDRGLKAINDGDFHVSDNAIDELRANVKSRSQSKLFVSELEVGVAAVEKYVGALDREIQLRAELIEQLERSEIFYDTQRSDAKVVAVAYKNFSKRVREVRRKLEECLPKLPDVSPVPSPDVNAPSPTNSDDGLQLPEDAAAEEKAAVDPRSEIERLLGNWTSGKSNSPQSTEACENGGPGTVATAGDGDVPGPGMSTFVGSNILSNLAGGGQLTADLFPGFEASPLTNDERNLFPGPGEPQPSGDSPAVIHTPERPVPSEAEQQAAALAAAAAAGTSFSPPPPGTVSAISVVTGVQQCAASPQPATPLQDDYDDEYDGGLSGHDDETPEPQLSDFVRMIGRQLDRAGTMPDISQPPPQVQIPGLEQPAPGPPPAAAPVQIPGLDLSGPPDLSRPPPVIPGLSQPPLPVAPLPAAPLAACTFPTVPPPDPVLWSGPRAPPAPRTAQSRPWQELDANGSPPAPPWKERPPAALDRDRSWEDLTGDGPSSPPPYEKGNEAYNADIDLPAAFKAVSELARLPFSTDTDHRTLLPVPLPVPPPPQPVPPPPQSATPATAATADTDSRGDTDHRIWDRSVDAFISQVTEDRDYRRRSSVPAADADYRPPATDLSDNDDHRAEDMDIDSGEESRRLSRDKPADTAEDVIEETPPPEVSPVVEVISPPRQPTPELVQLEEEEGGEPSAPADDSAPAADRSISSWSSTDESADDDSEQESSRHRRRSSKKKRRRRDSGGRRHKKERRHSHKRDRRSSGDGERRRRHDGSEERQERRRRDKHDSKTRRRRSRDESTERSRKERDSEREKSRGHDRSRERHRGRDRSPERDRERRRSRERERSRHRDRERSRERSPHRRSDAGPGVGFDYSVVGAGAHKSTHRDRSSRRW